mgnify:FL=1
MFDVVASNGGTDLAGSVWIPRSEVRAGVLMFPGSGPADRHNDVVFPPIRDRLVARGIAVASFDKRGVGSSGGDWRTVGLDVLASDAVAEMDVLEADGGVPAGRVGLLGHSHGGRVVLEAAADERTAFEVTHSGPGVAVWEQVGHAARMALASTTATASAIDAAAVLLVEGMEVLREGRPWQAFADRVAGPLLAPHTALLERAGFAWPTSSDRRFLRLILGYDPAPALERLHRPVLAVHGAADALVPVDRSVEAFERSVGRRGLLTTIVFPGADHRLRIGDPPRPVPGYPDAIADWILRVTSGKGVHP